MDTVGLEKFRKSVQHAGDDMDRARVRSDLQPSTRSLTLSLKKTLTLRSASRLSSLLGYSHARGVKV